MQESLEKISKLKDLKINWHFIGNIQSNKCEEIAKNFDWIHTIDRLKIARLIDKYCPEDKSIKCLIQINIDDEESKSGIKVEEVEIFLKELNKLWIHGFLHLFGYNHKIYKDYIKMNKIEKRYLYRLEND